MALTNQEAIDNQPKKASDGGTLVFNNTSYSGADIKIVVNLYKSQQNETKINELDNSVKESQSRLQDIQGELADINTQLLTVKTGTREYDRLSNRRTDLLEQGSDLKFVTNASQAQLEQLQKEQQKAGSLVLAECQTLSLSVYRDKQDVRALGSVYPKGFCVSESSRILTKDKGYLPIKDIKIGDYVESSPGNFNKVYGHFSQGRKKCFSVKTKYGCEIEATADHKIYTNNGWKEVSELKIGDKVATSGFVKSNIKDFDCPDWIIKMIGFLIGDGSIRKYQKNNGSIEYRISLSIANSELDTIGKEVEQILFENNIPFKDYPVKSGGSVQRRISVCLKDFNKTDYRLRKYNQLHNFLLENNLYGCLSETKFVPSCFISKLSNRQIKLFLNRLFSTDGCYVKESTGRIRAKYTSTSKKLVQEIRLLLLKLGIISKISKEQKKGKIGGRPNIVSKHDAYHLTIDDSLNLYSFVKQVNIFSKESKVNFDKKSLFGKNKSVFLNISMKEFRAKAKPYIQQAGFKVKKFGSKHNLYNSNLLLTPRKAIKVAEEISNPTFLKEVEALIESTLLKKEQYLFLEIVSIEDVGDKETYDISVENDSQFVSNFIQVHNCRGPRKIAGSMIFTVFNQDVLYTFMKEHPSDFDAVRYTTAILDQMPPVDIIVSFANEYGNLSRMAIYGVEFFTEGKTYSIENIITENAVNYIARDYDPMRSVGKREFDKSSGQLQNRIIKTASDLLFESDFKEYNDQVSPFRRTTDRRNPFL